MPSDAVITEICDQPGCTRTATVTWLAERVRIDGVIVTDERRTCVEHSGFQVNYCAPVPREVSEFQ